MSYRDSKSNRFNSNWFTQSNKIKCPHMRNKSRADCSNLWPTKEIQLGTNSRIKFNCKRLKLYSNPLIKFDSSANDTANKREQLINRSFTYTLSNHFYPPEIQSPVSNALRPRPPYTLHQSVSCDQCCIWKWKLKR